MVRYHHLFAEFLQRRLARETNPNASLQLHATASRWFAEHHLMREAVDHAIAAGDEERAIELMELHGIDLTEHAQMSTLLALVSKLPPHIVACSPRLQLTPRGRICCCSGRQPRSPRWMRSNPPPKSARSPRPKLRDMRVEADVIRAVMECYADRTAGVDELVSECLSRPETLAAGWSQPPQTCRVVPRDVPVRFRRRPQVAGLGGPLPPSKAVVHSA